MFIGFLTRVILLSLLFTASIFVRKLQFDWQIIFYFLGGVVGLLLAESDRLLYVFFIKPQELVSQRALSFVKSRKYSLFLRFLKREESSMQNLIFHSAFFQTLFLILAFYVSTSSGSLLGKGISFGILFSTLFTQFWQIIKTNSIKNWFDGMDLNLKPEFEAVYWLLISICFLLIMFLL